MTYKNGMVQALFNELERIMPHTVWIVKAKDGFVAIDYKGTIVAMNKYKSTCAHIVRKEAAQYGILAIADVVETECRQLNRRLRRRKP